MTEEFGRAGSRRLVHTMTDDERIASQRRHERRLLATAAKRVERELELIEKQEDESRTMTKPWGAR